MPLPSGKPADPLVIGLDLGTSACKAVALDSRGRVRITAQASYSLKSDSEGRAEQDAHEVWQAVVSTLSDLTVQAGDLPLSGLSLSGAMHNFLPVDAGGEPLGPAMTWADTRPDARPLRAKADPHTLYQRTGCPLQSIYHPAKLAWLARAQPQTFAAAKRFVAIKDWVLYRLTGSLVTDSGLASTTGLLDIHRLVWDEEAMTLAGIRPEQLPELVSADTVVGGITDEAAALTGLPPGLPVVAGSSDGGLANLGAGVVVPGMTVVTVGTSAAIRHLSERPRFDPQARTWSYLLTPGRHFSGGAINSGGLVLEWVRRIFYSDLPRAAGFEALLEDATSSEPQRGDLVWLPYLAGERSPHWDPHLSATLYGLSLHHGREHLARAALEGVAFCLADVWQVLQPESRLGVRLTGNITRTPAWAQLLADVLGVPLELVSAADASAVGAAMLGHEALGHVDGLDSLAETVPGGHVLEPDQDRHDAYLGKHRNFQALFHSLHPGDR
ncbi:MAG: gluconokinase [Trueperaceae bacterium]|nr:MAG: gluconokinase [Trueperaceae bacterium]